MCTQSSQASQAVSRSHSPGKGINLSKFAIGKVNTNANANTNTNAIAKTPNIKTVKQHDINTANTLNNSINNKTHDVPIQRWQSLNSPFTNKNHEKENTNRSIMLKDEEIAEEKDLEKNYFIPLNERKYNILLILTDGKIDDMQETKNILVEASNYPISVIIVGIGNSNFGNMNEIGKRYIYIYILFIFIFYLYQIIFNLGGESNAFNSSNGIKRERDIVQFVEFSKFENNGDLLAEKVLKEIPKQIEEYYRLHGI